MTDNCDNCKKLQTKLDILQKQLKTCKNSYLYSQAKLLETIEELHNLSIELGYRAQICKLKVTDINYT